MTSYETELSEVFDKLTVDRKKILYFSVVVRDTVFIHLLLKQLFEDDEIKEYKLNEHFHCTLLYVGGKENDHINELLPFNGAKCTIIINSIAKSDDFIVLAVSSIIDENGYDLPYFGNPIKHITIGLKKTKKLSPVNSPSAFNLKDAFKQEVLFPLKAVVSIFSKK
jgi:hypothetical protein